MTNDKHEPISRPPYPRLNKSHPPGATCCRCDEPISNNDAAAFVPGLNRGAWAHRTCLPREQAAEDHDASGTIDADRPRHTGGRQPALPVRPHPTSTDRAGAASSHERSTVRGSATLVLDHYLEVLVRKPGALPGATALVQARKAGVFTPAHDAFWAAARKAHGDAEGTRELVEVLLLHRHLTAADVVDGLAAALTIGAVRADVVAVEARRVADQRPIDLTGDCPTNGVRGG